MNVLLQLAWSFVEGLLFPWKFLVLTAWSLFWWTTLGGISLAWRFLSTPLRILTAAWREQQVEEKVVVLQSKMDVMAVTIVDLEKNLEIAQMERLRMRDKLDKALEDRKNFYERAVRAIAKAQRLKKEAAERFQFELVERGTDVDSDRPDMDAKSEAHGEDGDDHLEHVQSEDLVVEQEQGGTIQGLPLSGSQEVKQSANSADEVKPDDIGENEPLIEESDSQTGGLPLQKAEKIKIIRSPDNKMRSAGVMSSIICAVLAFLGPVAAKVIYLRDGNDQPPYALAVGLTGTGVLALYCCFLFLRLKERSKRRRGQKGKVDDGVKAVLMLSLIWLFLGFFAFPLLRVNSFPVKNVPAGINDGWQKYVAPLASVAKELLFAAKGKLSGLGVGDENSGSGAIYGV